MFGKGSKLYSIFNSKCPQCQEGNFFKHPLSFNILKTTLAEETCSHCNIKYMREPSFFYGAMYVGYALSVAIAVALFIISHIFIGLSLIASFIFLSVGLVLLAPWTLRLSRMIWINIFIKYEKDPEKRIV